MVYLMPNHGSGCLDDESRVLAVISLITQVHLLQINDRHFCGQLLDPKDMIAQLLI
jgi:hypothetical protein